MQRENWWENREEMLPSPVVDGVGGVNGRERGSRR